LLTSFRLHTKTPWFASVFTWFEAFAPKHNQVLTLYLDSEVSACITLGSQLLAAHLRTHVENKSHYLFPTASGNPLCQRNVLRALHATGKIGLRSLRRFRTETLRRARVPEDLTKLWLGHSKESITDFYAGGLQNDLAWRQEWCERAGLGFGLHGLQKANAQVEAKAE